MCVAQKGERCKRTVFENLGKRSHTLHYYVYNHKHTGLFPIGVDGKVRHLVKRNLASTAACGDTIGKVEHGSLVVYQCRERKRVRHTVPAAVRLAQLRVQPF